MSTHSRPYGDSPLNRDSNLGSVQGIFKSIIQSVNILFFDQDQNVYMNEVYEIIRHRWPLQRHNSCKPRPCIKKKNHEEIVLPCLNYINFMWFLLWKREKDFWFSFQDIGPQTPDRTEPNRLGEENKVIFLPFSGFCCSGFCRCYVLRAALLFSPDLR